MIQPFHPYPCYYSVILYCYIPCRDAAYYLPETICTKEYTILKELRFKN